MFDLTRESGRLGIVSAALLVAVLISAFVVSIIETSIFEFLLVCFCFVGSFGALFGLGTATAQWICNAPDRDL